MGISKQFQQRFIDLCDELDEKNKAKRAIIIGISNTTYSNAYNYGITPTVPSLIRIADFFNVSVDYLLGISETDALSRSAAPKTFIARLEELRAERKISTVYELSQLTHIHRNNFAQWIKHGYLPLPDDLILLADFFEVSVDYLLGRTDDK